MPPEPISSSIRYLPLSLVPITVVIRGCRGESLVAELTRATVAGESGMRCPVSGILRRHGGQIRYHTDPACPWSWALEPAVRKLMVDFGDGLEWTFVMGGLGAKSSADARTGGLATHGAG